MASSASGMVKKTASGLYRTTFRRWLRRGGLVENSESIIGEVGIVWFSSGRRGSKGQRTDATLADRICPRIQVLPEGKGLRRIQHGLQAARHPDIAQRRLEKAGANRPIGLDHAGDPGRVAG